MHMPVLFVSHGAPSLLFDDVPARAFLSGLAAKLPVPSATVVVSAHWQERQVKVGCQREQDTIHDFGGFGPELEAWQYQAPGSPELSRREIEVLTAAGIDAVPSNRGLDHGAWVPLSLLWPAAAMPVVPVSLTVGDEAAHLALGRALQPLRDEGVLILGTGAATHPLAAAVPGIDRPAPWVESFDRWLGDAVMEQDLARLCAWRKAPEGRRAHPTSEHLLPLFVCLGAAGDQPRVHELHHSWTWHVLSMAAWRWD